MEDGKKKTHTHWLLLHVSIIEATAADINLEDTKISFIRIINRDHLHELGNYSVYREK